MADFKDLDRSSLRDSTVRAGDRVLSAEPGTVAFDRLASDPWGYRLVSNPTAVPRPVANGHSAPLATASHTIWVEWMTGHGFAPADAAMRMTRDELVALYNAQWRLT